MELFIANKNYSSWSLRPWILLKELGIEFKEHLLPFGDKAPFLKASPTGKVPCLHHQGVVVWDSLAITEYVHEIFPDAGVWPINREARAWCRSACAEMHSSFTSLRSICSMNCGVRVKLLDDADKSVQADLARLDQLWSEGLNRHGGPFLGGAKFSAVDAFFCPVAFRFLAYNPSGLSRTCLEYTQRLRDLPGMKLWYEQALVEPWRDEPHDAEIAKVGKIIEDLRK